MSPGEWILIWCVDILYVMRYKLFEQWVAKEFSSIRHITIDQEQYIRTVLDIHQLYIGVRNYVDLKILQVIPHYRAMC